MHLNLRADPAQPSPKVCSGVDGAAASTSTAAERVIELRERHAGALHGYLRRVASGDHQLVENLVQETFLRAWRYADRIPADHTAVRPWLFAVARNLAINAWRARRARPTEVSDDLLANKSAPADPIDDLLTRQVVREALATLSHDHRQILLEVYYRDRTVAEAASLLGIPVGTAKSRIFYAMKALRPAIERHFGPSLP